MVLLESNSEGVCIMSYSVLYYPKMWYRTGGLLLSLQAEVLLFSPRIGCFIFHCYSIYLLNIEIRNHNPLKK